MVIEKHPIIFNKPKKVFYGSSWLTHTPFAFFLISILKPNVFVELGVYCGQSYSAFCQAVKTLKLNTRCFGIDTWEGDNHVGNYNESVYSNLCYDTLKDYADFSQLLRMTFREALPHFKDGSIDLLHIDGCHTYEEAKNDFKSWLPKMSHQGVMIFHDSFIKDQDFGVWKLWEEISKKYPSFQFLHGCGLGVAAIGKKVNKDFIKFLDEANSRGFYGKLFNALGDLASNEARIINLETAYNNYKLMVSRSLEWEIGSKIHRLIDSIIPHDSFRRKFVTYIIRPGITVFKSFRSLFHRDKNSDFAISDIFRGYHHDTIKSLETMPLPSLKEGKKKCAIFVMVKNERMFLPIWLRYYSRYFDAKDMYVLDHCSTDGTVKKCLQKFKFNVVRLEYSFSFDHVWFKHVADYVQKKLLNHYEYVIFTDVDEIILPDANKYKGLDDYICKLNINYVRCRGYELIHLPEKEYSYNPGKSVLSQRKYWYSTPWYNKTLISNQPLDWEIGFHNVNNLDLGFDNDLMLIHLHKLDFNLCWEKSFERARLMWLQDDIINNRGWQNRITDIDKFRTYYYEWPEGLKIEEIPEELRKSKIF